MPLLARLELVGRLLCWISQMENLILFGVGFFEIQLKEFGWLLVKLLEMWEQELL